jgi:hypothetical protein
MIMECERQHAEFDVFDRRRGFHGQSERKVLSVIKFINQTQPDPIAQFQVSRLTVLRLQ